MLQMYQMKNSVPYVMHILSLLPSDLVTINHAGISYTALIQHLVVSCN
jgi:hypothetical protein